MSLLQSPRRPSSDDLDPDHLHVGLDQELDLSAERPSTHSVEGKRGPGLLVAAIVASSLALAGIILMVRGEPTEVPSDADPPPPIPEVLAAPTEPTVVEPASTAPVSEPVRTPSRVAAQVPPPALDPVPPLPPAAPTAPDASIPTAIAPTASIPTASIPTASIPTAIAPTIPTPRAPAAPSEPAPSASVVGGSPLRLPAPVFDEPPSAPAPRPAEDEVDDPLPGVEEPSIFEPADDPEDDELPEEPSLPSSTTARDALEAIDGMLDDEPTLDAPAA